MKRAFTLIELLVVIGVIAILAAILFPVFARAKTAAKQSACLSNLRQLGQAAALYSADFDEVGLGAADGYFGEGKLGGWIFYSQFASAEPGKFDVTKGALFPYVKSAAIFESPGAPRKSGLSYAINGCLVKWPLVDGVNPGRPLGLIEKPAETIHIAQEGLDDGSFRFDSPTNDGFFNPIVDHFSFWFNGRSNALYLDGHVKSIGGDDLVKTQLLQGRETCE